MLRTWASKSVSLGEYGHARMVLAKHSLVGFEEIGTMYMPANGCTILVIGPESNLDSFITNLFAKVQSVHAARTCLA